MTKEVLRFLEESNLIEGVGLEGLEDSIKAYNYLMQVKLPLQEKHILKTHKLLMRSLYPEIAGKIRIVSVGIYSRDILIKKCLDFREIDKELGIYLSVINNVSNMGVEKSPSRSSRSKEWTENHCESMHIKFEEIHPFKDGNGRVGRLLFNWHRKQLGLPLLIIYNNNKQEYYKWFK